ncbi:claudin [Sarotherodon galilaeus]
MISSSPFLLLLLSGWGLLGFVSGSPAVEEAYGAVVSIVSPGQQYLTGESLHSLFNTLENRVQCGEVPCEKCDLADAVHQLINNPAVQNEEETRRSRINVAVTVSQFTALASGCTENFLHKFTHNDPHEHNSEANHDHEHIDVHGLEGVIQELQSHYEPTESEYNMRKK